MRLAILGPSGSGKTYSALQLAFGLGSKIGMLDTEHGSGELYAHLGAYDVITLTPPFTIANYLAAIRTFERAGYDTIIIDSLSHAWAGEGGLLEKVDKIKGNSANSFGAWRTVTPEHNSLVEAMLQSSSHIIVTMRTKTEYVLETNEKGKQVPRKIGMAPVQRDGLEYEFTVVLDVNADHVASASKDRTSLFDGQWFKVSPKTGEMLKSWLASAAAPPDEQAPTPQPASAKQAANSQPEKSNGEIPIPADFSKNADYQRIVDILKSDRLTSRQDVRDFMHDEANLATIKSWPAAWQAVVRGLMKTALDRHPEDQSAAA
jgi:hypothetical protein